MVQMLLVIIGIVVILFFGYLYQNTGFLKAGRINERDLQEWTYENGIIKGVEGFTLEGNSGKCWVMAHGYTSTPPVFRELAERINKEFDDTVIVPRLKGHAMLPTELLKYSVVDWFEEIHGLMHDKGCDYLVGSSMMAGLALKYAEEHEVKGLVLLGAYIKPPSFLESLVVVKLVSRFTSYSWKDRVGTIDDPEGLKVHIANWGFPFKAVVEYYEDFVPGIVENAGKIDSRVLFLHGKYDTVADIRATKKVFDKIGGEKLFVETDGNHLILRDYDKEKAIDEILKFRLNQKV